MNFTDAVASALATPGAAIQQILTTINNSAPLIYPRSDGTFTLVTAHTTVAWVPDADDLAATWQVVT